MNIEIGIAGHMLFLKTRIDEGPYSGIYYRENGDCEEHTHNTEETAKYRDRKYNPEA